jgi:hypothetical protein
VGSAVLYIFEPEIYMKEIKIVVSPYALEQVNALWNMDGNLHELPWEYPKVIPSPKSTTDVSSPWWTLSMLWMNACSVPEGFLAAVNRNKIEYFAEADYYKILTS